MAARYSELIDRIISQVYSSPEGRLLGKSFKIRIGHLPVWGLEDRLNENLYLNIRESLKETCGNTPMYDLYEENDAQLGKCISAVTQAKVSKTSSLAFTFAYCLAGLVLESERTGLPVGSLIFQFGCLTTDDCDLWESDENLVEF